MAEGFGFRGLQHSGRSVCVDGNREQEARAVAEERATTQTIACFGLRV